MQKKPSLKSKMVYTLQERLHVSPSKIAIRLLNSTNKQNLRNRKDFLFQQDISSGKMFLPSMGKNNGRQFTITSRGRASFNMKKNHRLESLNAKALYQSQKHVNTLKNIKNQEKPGEDCLTHHHIKEKSFQIKGFEMEKRNGLFLYYISDVKREVVRSLAGSDQPNIVIAHFLQSIATFHIFRKVRIPRDPHLSITLPSINPLLKDRPTLIFDMDETLLHCSESYEGDADAVPLEMENSTGEINKVYLKCDIRPYAREVLARLSKNYEIGVFTAGRQPYATTMLKVFDPEDKIFAFKFFRQHCHPYYHSEGPDPLNVKDLRIFRNRDIKKILLIDNSAHTYLFQPENAVPIVSYYGDEKDSQLLKLETFIDKYFSEPPKDVRQLLTSYFQVQEYRKYKSAKQICNKLY